MIETDEQRRWWFATHPEFSWNHRGEGAHAKEEIDDGKVDPKEVDAYVDKALQHLDGPVADLLRSVKRNFGTEAYSQKGGQNLRGSAGDGEDGWASLAGYYADGGAFMPRLPTTQELLQWPREMARRFLGWLDTLLQNNPLIIDPNALERHHGLPKEFVKYFLDCGLRIDEFIIIMRVADHRLKPDGLHTGEGRGGNWNREWREFIDQYPAENTREQQDRIEEKLEEMIQRYGIDKRTVLSPGRPKR